MTRLILQQAESLFLYLKDKESSTVSELCDYLKLGGFNINKPSSVSGIVSVVQSRFPIRIRRRKGIYIITVKN